MKRQIPIDSDEFTSLACPSCAKGFKGQAREPESVEDLPVLCPWGERG